MNYEIVSYKIEGREYLTVIPIDPSMDVEEQIDAFFDNNYKSFVEWDFSSLGYYGLRMF